MEKSGTASDVARFIAAALDWSVSPDARSAAISYLDAFKTGDIHVLANTSFILVKNDWSSEIRLHAFKMLQHLVRLRWEELSSTERRSFAAVVLNLMSEIANPSEEWALKSQASALVAEMIRSEGEGLWHELLPSLVSLSNNGPTQAELVLMTLRWLPEDITVHNEDLEGDRRRLLLRGLAHALPEILPLLYTLLQRHFEAAMTEAGRQQIDIAKLHACAVTAALHAVNAYAEWAPLPDLARHGIIYGCGCLLSSRDFRLHACEFFKLISTRKTPVEDSVSEFGSAMSNLFQLLMDVSKKYIFEFSSNVAVVDESDFEFAEYICESMVCLGTSNLQFISKNNTMLLLYLQQMLGYFQHVKLAPHFQALSFWNGLLKDLASKPKNVVHAFEDKFVTNSGNDCKPSDIEKKQILSFISDDSYTVILDTSFQRLLRREKVHLGTAHSFTKLELWSNDFEGKGDFSQYRFRLLELIRHIASIKPLIAASRVSEIIVTMLNFQMPGQDIAVMESMQVALENVVIAIFDVSNDSGFGQCSPEHQAALCHVFEGLLHQLLSLKWTEPASVGVIGRYLEALGPFLKYFPNAVDSVINKLFELLTSLPTAVQNPSTSISRQARLQISASFVRIAKAADGSLLPHMKGIADTMAYLQENGHLLRGEHNALGEACLVIASNAGVQQQQEVLCWLLEPLSKQWTQIEWQNAYLSEPAGLVRLCRDPNLMWSFFHTLTFFEKALKRSGIKKGNQIPHKDSLIPSSHLMAGHLPWMLPPLINLLRGIHSFWSPQVTQGLPEEIKSATIMGDNERSPLGEGNLKVQPSIDISQIDTNKDVYAGLNETDIRNWLKGVRDSGYNVLGMSATIGDTFFKCLNINSLAPALFESIQSMEFRHIKQLVHAILNPLVKSCPLDLWEEWLEKLLCPLFLHTEQSLSRSWTNVMREGRAKLPDTLNITADSNLKVEVMEEKILRDLSREICSFLSVLASSGLNNGLPSLEHFGNATRPLYKDLDAYASSSMVGFILRHKSMGIPAMKICLAAFSWTDGEAVSRVSPFCGTLILLAVSTNNPQLVEFVAKDLFYAIIQGLGLESNAIVSGELVGLCRDIFIYLRDRDPAPRQILLSLPCIESHDLHAFEDALNKTASPREQKQHMKSLLLLGTGNNLKALAPRKSVRVITNVSGKMRGSSESVQESRNEEESIGLAGIM